MQSQNLDPDERRKFDEIAASWWDPEGAFRPLHELNPARVSYIASRCNLTDARILDVGCGGGILSESLARQGGRVTGMDVAPKALSVARLHLLESGLEVEYIESTVEHHAASSHRSYDVITCLEMLEHVPDPVSVIQSISLMLKPGGHVFFSTINRNATAFLLAIVGAEHMAGLLPKGTHRFDRFIKPSELSSWLRESNLAVEDIRGLHYDPVSRSTHLGGHVKVNYLLHARKDFA